MSIVQLKDRSFVDLSSAKFGWITVQRIVNAGCASWLIPNLLAAERSASRLDQKTRDTLGRFPHVSDMLRNADNSTSVDRRIWYEFVATIRNAVVFTEMKIQLQIPFARGTQAYMREVQKLWRDAQMHGPQRGVLIRMLDRESIGSVPASLIAPQQSALLIYHPRTDHPPDSA